MSNLAWLYVALAIIGVAIGGYVVLLGARQKRLERRRRELLASRH